MAGARPWIFVAIASAIVLAPLAEFASAQEQAPKPAAQREQPAEAPPEEVRILTIEDMLMAEVAELKSELQAMREELARAQLEASQAQRELEELRQFVADHQQFGGAFEKYQAFLEIKEREARQKRAEEYREKARQAQAERQARAEAAKAERAAREERRAELRQYEDEGFYHLGEDVFASAMAYLYKEEDVPDTSYRFVPLIRFDGTFFFTRRYWHVDYDEEIDYTEMTISGSVLNAADEPRNIGLAISFFDNYGNHVGGTSIEIENARSNAPYPFTETLSMALDRPFYSYRIIVLYAEPIETEAETD